MKTRSMLLFLGGFVACIAMIAVFAAGGKVSSPTGTAPDRYVYYPGTEELGPDEIRIVACGTGMPTTRAAQAAAFMNGHPAVYPDDVKAVLPHVFGHRLVARDAGRLAADHIRGSLEEIAETTPVPV